ncbi:MAG TPA: hypothetical protein PKD49_14000 [Hyphomicrobium sp.]|nr:hypothetical protein [Hyphomicrobium sp.]
MHVTQVKRRCVVHVGMDKTGTSSLQATLAASASTLARLGFHYPLTGRISDHHLPFAAALGFSKGNDVQVTPGLLDAMREELAGTQLVPVLSTEHFSYSACPETIGALREFLAGYDVEIVVFLRNQMNWLVSLYAEAIKWGYVGSCSQYAQHYADRLNYLAFLSEWERVFGRERIRVVSYDLQRDTIASFLQILLTDGCSDRDVALMTQTVNTSPSPVILEAFRQWVEKKPPRRMRNLFKIAHTLPPRVAAKTLQRLLLDKGGMTNRNAYQTVLMLSKTRLRGADKHVWPIPGEIMEIIPALEESNAEIERRYLNGGKLFPAPLVKSAHAHNSKLMNDAEKIRAIVETRKVLDAVLV